MTTHDLSVRRLLASAVDRSSPLPIYAQIATAIRALIEAGTLPDGSLLPPEKVLCEVFGVSRMTLRQAYEALDRDGLISSQRGRGTQVSLSRLRKEQQRMRSFSEEIRARGGDPRSQVLRFEAVSPTPESQNRLRLPQGQLVYMLERIRFNGTAPMALETVALPCFLFPGLDRFDLARHSLYEVLEQEYKVRLGHCVETISALMPNTRERKLLQIGRGIAILRIERSTSTVNDTPAELATSTFRGDVYQAIVHSTREQQRP